MTGVLCAVFGPGIPRTGLLRVLFGFQKGIVDLQRTFVSLMLLIEPFEVDEDGAVVRTAGMVEDSNDGKRLMQVVVPRSAAVSEPDFIAELDPVLFCRCVADHRGEDVGVPEHFPLHEGIRLSVRPDQLLEVVGDRADYRRALVAVSHRDRNCRLDFRGVAAGVQKRVVAVGDRREGVLVVEDGAQNQLEFAPFGSQDQVVPLRSLPERFADHAVDHQDGDDQRDPQRDGQRGQTRGEAPVLYTS